MKYSGEEQRCDNETANKQRSVLLSTGEGLLMRWSLMEGEEGKMSAFYHAKKATGCKVQIWQSITPSCAFPLWFGRIPLGMLLFMRIGRALFAGHWQDIAVLCCHESSLVKVAPGEEMQWKQWVSSLAPGCVGHLWAAWGNRAAVGHRALACQPALQLGSG